MAGFTSHQTLTGYGGARSSQSNLDGTENEGTDRRKVVTGVVPGKSLVGVSRPPQHWRLRVGIMKCFTFFPTILAVENHSLKAKLILQRPIFHFHDYGRKSTVFHILAITIFLELRALA